MRDDRLRHTSTRLVYLGCWVLHAVGASGNYSLVMGAEVKTRSVHDEQIDNLANTAMQATLEALVVSGDMTNERACEIADTHICMVIGEDTVFERVRNKLFGKRDSDNCVVFKVMCRGLE